MKAPTLPILRNGQHLLFTPSRDNSDAMEGGAQWLSGQKTRQRLGPLTWICSSHDAIRTLEDLGVWGILKGLAQGQVNVST